MTTLIVFDPAMCCSTGVCGPTVDPALATFAADLSWLAEQGVTVQRHNLSQEPKAFADNDVVHTLLAERGDHALPAVLVDGQLRSSGRHPDRSELAGWVQTGASSGGLDAVTRELVAIGAAVGANCEPCLKYHYNEARRLGVEPTVMAAAVDVAREVKEAPARSILKLAGKLLGTSAGTSGTASESPGETVTSSEAPTTSDGACCGGEPATSTDRELPMVNAVGAGSSGCCA